MIQQCLVLLIGLGSQLATEACRVFVKALTGNTISGVGDDAKQKKK